MNQTMSRDDLIISKMKKAEAIAVSFASRHNIMHLVDDLVSTAYEELVITADFCIETSTDMDDVLAMRISGRLKNLVRDEAKHSHAELQHSPRVEHSEFDRFEELDVFCNLAETDLEFHVLSRLCKAAFGPELEDIKLRPPTSMTDDLALIASELQLPLSEVVECVECLQERYELFYND